MRHQHGEGNEMQAGQRLRQAFVVASQAAEARHPGKTAFDYPTPRQQHKAALGGGQLDDFQPDAIRLSVSSGLVAGIPLVHKGNLDRATGSLLDLFGQCTDLRSVLLVSGGDYSIAASN